MPAVFAKLHFKCPEDFQLLELADLSLNVYLFYDELQLAIEGEDMFRVYGHTRVVKAGPKEKIVLREAK
jgi:hypothetical protein